MQYTDHPDYPQYANIITELLNTELPIVSEQFRFTSKTQPPLIRDQLVLEKEYPKETPWIGKQYRNLKVLGILKIHTKQKQQKRFVCQCDCGNYHTIPTKYVHLTQNRYGSCEECMQRINSFEKAFAGRTQKFLSKEVIMSIYGYYNGVPFDNFIRHEVNKQEVEELNKLPIRTASMDELKALLSPKSDPEHKYFILTHDGNGLINTKSCKIIQNLSLTPFESFKTDRKLPRFLSNNLGKRIFKLTIIDFNLIDASKRDIDTKNNIVYNCKCDCGYHTQIQHKHLQNIAAPICPRCEVVANEIIRRELVNSQKQILPLEAWKILGLDTSKIEDEKVAVLVSKFNSFSHERTPNEPATSFEKYQRLIGLRFGLVTVTNKSKKLEKDEIGYKVVCKCDCGNECVHPFLLFSNPRIPPYLACDTCTQEINKVVSPISKKAVGKTANDKERAWKEYLTYKNFPQTISFLKVYGKFLELKQVDPELTLDDAILEILNFISPKARKVHIMA